MIDVKIIADSIAENSPRLITFECSYPRFIHSEVMTHRMFSRNASSSRAIPVTRTLKEVENSPAMPEYGGAEQPGMQSGEKLSPDDEKLAIFHWKSAAKSALKHALELQTLGVHKSITNRLLEPFLHIRVIITSCEPGLVNFFHLRLNPSAQPEMFMLAAKMYDLYSTHTPQMLNVGEWHLPFTDELTSMDLNIRRQISVARCARVSYKSFITNKPSLPSEDVKLFDKLLTSRHLSPFEHQATPGNSAYGNLPGWIQFRSMVEPRKIGVAL